MSTLEGSVDGNVGSVPIVHTDTTHDSPPHDINTPDTPVTLVAEAPKQPALPKTLPQMVDACLLQTSRRRVKLYQLNDSGQWDDIGTGFLQLRVKNEVCVSGSNHLTRKNVAYITVYREDDIETLLLNTRLSEDDIYQRQQETLVVWNEPSPNNDDGIDQAISFQEPIGCDEICYQIMEIQNKLNEGRPSKLHVLPNSLICRPHDGAR